MAGCTTEGAWRIDVGSDTGQVEAAVDCEGEVTLMPPPPWWDGKSSVPRAAAATLTLSGLVAAGLIEVDASRAAGAPLGAPYVRVLVEGCRPAWSGQIQAPRTVLALMTMRNLSVGLASMSS